MGIQSRLQPFGANQVMVWCRVRSREVCLGAAGKVERDRTDLDGKTVEYAHVVGEYCCG